MYTHVFQFFFVLCTLVLVVAAIRTYRSDRREKQERINDAYLLAQAYVQYRFENGWYHDDHDEQIQKDFYQKYAELIS